MLCCKPNAFTSPLHRLAGIGDFRFQAKRWLGTAFAFAALAFALPTNAAVAIYENVFEGSVIGPSYYYDEEGPARLFECHAYGPWGIPSLTFSIVCVISGGTKSIVLKARDTQWPVLELDTPAPEFDNVNWDDRAAWFITTDAYEEVSVSNTVYRNSVFKDEGTGRNIPEYTYSVTCDAYDTIYLYLCFGHPNGTTLGWVEISIYDSYNVRVASSCVATGVKTLEVGTTAYTVYPESLLEGGIRQHDIFVDASAPAGGTGLSWESPLRSIQEAVNAVRLDGTTVHVKPGVYGSVTVDNSKFTINNLTCTFTVESTDGPEKTIIDGGGLNVSNDGSSAGSPTMACFWYGNNPVPLYDTIRGFTLHSSLYGVQYGRVENCIVSNCFYGVRAASAYNCLIVGNSNIGYGGINSVLQNCTVTRNATGITVAKACNSIIWGNVVDNAYDSSFKYATNCCIPQVSMVNQHNLVMVGPGNMMTDPCFIDASAGDYRLRLGSPCIDAGATGYDIGAVDLSGGMRVRGGGVDIGCFEFVSTVADTNVTHGVTVPPEWLEEHYGLDRATSLETAYQAAAMAETENPRIGSATKGKLSAWESYIWDLDPSDSNQTARAEIAIENGVPQVHIVPTSARRSYSLLGKASLDAGEWARSDNLSDAAFIETNRFFKVSVEVPPTASTRARGK